MCGIFGIVVPAESTFNYRLSTQIIKKLFLYSESRGKEASGLAFSLSQPDVNIQIIKSSYTASKLLKDPKYKRLLSKYLDSGSETATKPHFFMGHTRLVTNGSEYNSINNQPVVCGNTILTHNGIVVNHQDLWSRHDDLHQSSELDSEIIAALIEKYRLESMSPVNAARRVFSEIQGTATIATAFAELDTMMLATNNGSLYYAASDIPNSPIFFVSEKYSLERLLKYLSNKKLMQEYTVHPVRAGAGVSISLNTGTIEQFHLKKPFSTQIENERGSVNQNRNINIVSIESQTQRSKAKSDTSATKPSISLETEFAHIKENIAQLRRCTQCILPETVPFIEFDDDGVCIFCKFYKRHKLLGGEALEEAIKPYRRPGDEPDCIMAFSGGRDSSYGLQYIVKELGLKPITYTYDWGMVTDLARRNISRMCSQLGVENILISADIRTKRKNIRKNVLAWLKKPHLGMVPLFMAGDKQFIWYSKQVKKQNHIDLDIFTFNLLEKTQFKEEYSGIQLWNPGVDSDKFGEDLRLLSRVKLALFYAKQFLSNPAYLNTSLFDTFLGYLAYYFSSTTFIPLFNYVPWHEKEVDSTLLDLYDWEVAEDADSTWRIGDGTAPFYNYIYYALGGFSEHDVLRSNQIREREISRMQALELVEKDNCPRWSSIEWYCNTINLDFESTLRRINHFSKFLHRSDNYLVELS